MWEIFDPKDGRALASFEDLMKCRVYLSLLGRSRYDYAKKGEGWK